MKLSDFDYILPKELIAQYPLVKRDGCRLMVVDRRLNAIFHRHFKDFSEYLQPKDLLVLNNTKVMPVRLRGVKKDTLGKVDVLLCNRISGNKFEALIKPYVASGKELVFNHGSLKAKVVQGKVLEFNKAISLKILETIGVMPLPPYIKRMPEGSDILSYQTVYAKKMGAIASPTAGLHFTKGLLDKIECQKGRIEYVTLHVGLGTFKPVKCDDIKDHVMEKEEYCISKKTLTAIKRVKEKGKRVFAVGTTTTRVLETVADVVTGYPAPCVGEGKSPVTPRLASEKVSNRGYTNLFIYPGYQFKVADCLLTNFHLPKTTLLMLVCAFAGRDLIMRAYDEAIKGKYRFYSYGDAMLII